MKFGQTKGFCFLLTKPKDIFVWGTIMGSSFVFRATNKDKNFGEKAGVILSKFSVVISMLMKLVEFGNNIKGLIGVDFLLHPDK
jgi:hypothetical protein